MRTLVISDLHLGDGTGSDDFAYSEYRRLIDADASLMSWIVSINPDQVFLAGDVFELWQHDEARVRRIHDDLLKFLDVYKAQYIAGNHDDKQECFKPAFLIHSSGGKSVFIEHGHENDPVMRDPFIRWCIRQLARLEKCLPGIDSSVEAATSILGRSSIDRKTAKLAEKRLKIADFVVMGHTHKQGSWGNYFNCGTCQGGKHQGVLIEDGKLTLV